MNYITANKSELSIQEVLPKNLTNGESIDF